MSALTPPALAAQFAALTRAPHPVLERLTADANARGVPVVDPLTGALLHALTRLTGAAKVLEIGTGLGASALWVATALPPTGLLVSLEREHARATTARGYLRAAGVDGRVSVMHGEASRFLHKIAGPFDLIVQDGGPDQHAPLLDKLLRLLRPGGVLVTNDVAATASSASPPAFAERLAADARLTTTWLPVGAGLALSIAPVAPAATTPPDGESV